MSGLEVCGGLVGVTHNLVVHLASKHKSSLLIKDRPVSKRAIPFQQRVSRHKVYEGSKEQIGSP